jgi:hypothetical protein
MGGWVLAAGGARCPYRGAEGEGMRGRVVGSVGAGVSGLGRRQAWAWAREPDGDSGLQLQGLLFVAAEKAFDRAAGPLDGLCQAAPPPSAVPSSVSSSGGNGTLIAAALRPTLTVPV